MFSYIDENVGFARIAPSFVCLAKLCIPDTHTHTGARAYSSIHAMHVPRVPLCMCDSKYFSSFSEGHIRIRNYTLERVHTHTNVHEANAEPESTAPKIARNA